MLEFGDQYIANEEVKGSLISNLNRNVLITGVSGIGKTTLALMRANLIIHGSAVDDDKSANIQMIHSSRLGGGAAAIQELLNDVAHRFHKNAIIIDEFHTLSLAATEAFLPVLENNTPENTYWIFTTTHPEKVPAAVRSRLKIINLSTPSYEDLIKHKRFKDLQKSTWAKFRGNIRSIINNGLMDSDVTKPIDWADYVESMIIATDGSRDLYNEALLELTESLRMHSQINPEKSLVIAKKMARLTSAVIRTEDTVMRNIATVEIMH